jgi:hypothetical protein
MGLWLSLGDNRLRETPIQRWFRGHAVVMPVVEIGDEARQPGKGNTRSRPVVSLMR